MWLGSLSQTRDRHVLIVVNTRWSSLLQQAIIFSTVEFQVLGRAWIGNLIKWCPCIGEAGRFNTWRARPLAREPSLALTGPRLGTFHFLFFTPYSTVQHSNFSANLTCATSYKRQAMAFPFHKHPFITIWTKSKPWQFPPRQVFVFAIIGIGWSRRETLRFCLSFRGASFTR